MVEVEGLPKVASEEGQANLVLLLRIRSTHCRAQFALLILNHLLAPLGLRYRRFCQLLELLLFGRVLAICHLLKGFLGYIVEVSIGQLPLAVHLVLARYSHLLLQWIVPLNHIFYLFSL